MKEKNSCKKRINFESDDSDAWVALVELLEQKGIGLEGKSPIYIKVPQWEQLLLFLFGQKLFGIFPNQRI